VDERTQLIRKMSGASADRSGPKPIRAPMPGLIVSVEVGVGDRVGTGQGVVVMEAMKMENELRAEAAGTVAQVLVAAGETVEKGQILIALESADPRVAAAKET
jgi:pyruvate carboxylase subunit B